MNINKNLVINDPLAVIYNEGHWRICKVSPLHNLQLNVVKQKQYASKIRQAIVSSVQAKSAVKYTVVMKTQPYLKYSEDDPESFSITVSSSEEEKSKEIYTCIFLSWGVFLNVIHATHLPFMLEHGEQRIGTAVKTTFQNLFDCTIKQFSFTQNQLLKFAFNIVECDTSRSTDPFTFCYRTEVESKDNLNLTFEIGDINIIWNQIRSNESKESDKVTIAYNLMQNQIFYAIGLDVTPLNLYDISLSKAEVKSNGLIKMKTPEIVNCVFKVLNNIINDHN